MEFFICNDMTEYPSSNYDLSSDGENIDWLINIYSLAF